MKKGAQDDLVGLAGGAGILTTTRASAPKQGMKPAIAPNIKHQVASIVVIPCGSMLVQSVFGNDDGADLDVTRQKWSKVVKFAGMKPE
jgi:hypothetical protein